MKAWRVHEFGEPTKVLQLDEVPRPEPGPGQVQVELETTAASFAENLMMRGLHQAKSELPFSPGLEIAGRVSALGEGVEHRIGDRVVGVGPVPTGGLAEYCVVDAPSMFPIPDDIPFSVATALFGSYGCADFALHTRGQLQRGECVLVHAGASAVGSACIQLAKVAGAKVIATAGGERKAAFCLEMGADHAVDYLVDDFLPVVQEATGGRGADVVCDNVGGDVFDRTTKCIAPDGRILVIGFASGRIPTIAANRILLKNCSIVGVGGGTRKWSLGQSFPEFCDLYRQGKISPAMMLMPFDSVPEVYRRIPARESIGKFIIQIKE